MKGAAQLSYNQSSLEPMSSELDAIKALLLHEWDPIGISDVAEAKDEYDTYAFQMYTMLREGANETAIARYLNWVVTSRMSLPGNPDRDSAIATKAIAIHALGHR
jgi:hypothetical protein